MMIMKPLNEVSDIGIIDRLRHLVLFDTLHIQLSSIFPYLSFTSFHFLGKRQSST